MFKNLTKKERAWVLYDVGNSAFTMLACSLIPIYFKALAIRTTRTARRSFSRLLWLSALQAVS